MEMEVKIDVPHVRGYRSNKRGQFSGFRNLSYFFIAPLRAVLGGPHTFRMLSLFRWRVTIWAGVIGGIGIGWNAAESENPINLKKCFKARDG